MLFTVGETLSNRNGKIKEMKSLLFREVIGGGDGENF